MGFVQKLSILQTKLGDMASLSLSSWVECSYHVGLLFIEAIQSTIWFPFHVQYITPWNWSWYQNEYMFTTPTIGEGKNDSYVELGDSKFKKKLIYT
jgi:hypothetical protein